MAVQDNFVLPRKRIRVSADRAEPRASHAPLSSHIGAKGPRFFPPSSSRFRMSRPVRDNEELACALEAVLSKYFAASDDPSKGKSPEERFWGTYLRAMKDEDEERPRDWDGNTGSILTFVRHFLVALTLVRTDSCMADWSLRRNYRGFCN